VIVRSVEAASAVWPSAVSARLRKGFSGMVWSPSTIMKALQSFLPVTDDRGRVGTKRRTIVCVQTLFSTSHILMVESNPQLNATLPTPTPSPAFSKMALDTLAVCDFNTVMGALRFGLSSSVALRRFLPRSLSSTWAAGTSSCGGIEVSQSPMRPSQDVVRRCDPVG
jgi:hypothetical protein